jgi:hypothetical protein
MKRKAKSEALTKAETPPTSKPRRDDEAEIEHDDLCAICHCLLLRPVTTKCRHTLCNQCMEVWADISITRQMEIVGLDDTPMTLLPSEMESRCPMCRTLTTASPDKSRERALRRKYARAYRQRELDEQTTADEDFVESVETLTLYIGNTHQLIKPDSSGAKNTHNWKFFVRPSRTDLIEEVQVFLVRSQVPAANVTDPCSILHSGTRGSYCNTRRMNCTDWDGACLQYMPTSYSKRAIGG